VLDEHRRPLKWLTVRDLDSPSSLDAVGLSARSSVVERNATLHDALDLMITSFTGTVVVTEDDGSYVGVVELNAIRDRVDAIRREAVERMRKEPGAISPEELVS